jgi:tetratricopeptide (TPR) repeat protein
MMGLPLEGKYKERVKGIEGEALEKLILKNLRDLIIAATKDKPRIYMIEDMHWADSSSLTLFESLYKLSQQYPVMFINVMRPGYKDTGDYILKYLVDNFPGDHITINVSPLENADSGLLIRNLLHNIKLPADINEMIIRKSEGNPFFIEEIIRSFLDDGIIEVEHNGFRFTEKINEVNIPETINEVILSRVDKLDEKTKELLKTASVIGRNFYYKVLEEAADAIGELDDRLEYLKEIQIISEPEKKMEMEFLFKHALAQQATYESIVLKSKKELHHKIARSIEKVFADNLNEFYGTLVYHYEKAENPEKMEEYLLLAGDEAMRTGASSEAINLFKRAVVLVQNNTSYQISNVKINLLEEKLVFAYAARGLNAEVIELTSKILPRYNYPVRNYKHSEKLILIWLAIRFILMIRRYDRIKKRLPTEEEKFVTKMVFLRDVSMTIVNPTVFLIEMFKYLLAYKKIDISKTKYGSSHFAVSITFFSWAGFAPGISDKVIALAKKLHNPENDVSLIYIKTQEMIHNGLVGNWQPDQEQEQFLDLCFKKGEFFEATLYSVYRIYSEIELGKYESANTLINFLLEIAQKFENNTALAYAVRMKTLLDVKYRKIDLAKETGEEVLEFIKRSDDSGIFFALYCSMAQLYALTGNVDLAVEMLNNAKESLHKMEKIKIWKSKYFLSKSLVYFELAKRNTEPNKSYWKECLQASKIAVKSSEMVAPKITETNRIRAMILRRYGKQKAALKSFENAILHGERLKAKLELSRTYFELGKFLSDPDSKYTMLNGLDADHYLLKAKRLFEEMNLSYDLEAYQQFTDHR